MKQVILPEISEESLATTLEIISDGIWDWNANTGYVYRSPGWYTMLGYDVNAFENTVFTWESVIHEDDYARVMEHFEHYVTHKSSNYNIEYRCRTKKDDYIWIEDRGRIIEWNDDGSVARMIGAHRNINAEKLLFEKSKQQNLTLQDIVDDQTRSLIDANKKLEIQVREAELSAITDPLTSIANRRHFEVKLSTECARSTRFGEPLSLIAIDIDYFKDINDQYGHATGDLVLINVATILRANVREIDIPTRWGGDEFMLLLPNTPIEEAQKLAQKIRVLISDKKINKYVSVTASFGVVQKGLKEDTMRFTVRADNALYQAKDEGRNRVVFMK